MRAYFPKVYPDETVYSLVARYQVHAGSLTDEHTWQDLFNCRRVTLRMDLPGHLGKLAEAAGVTQETLLHQHTMFPFYAAFMSEARREKLAQEMTTGNGNKALFISGHMAGNWSTRQNFRFCAACIQADRRVYGEAYWHRIHQFPMLPICSLHAKPLKEVKAERGLLALESVQRSLARTAALKPVVRQDVLRLAQDAAGLLQQERGLAEFFHAKCMTRLQEMNLAGGERSHIRERAVAKMFTERYSREMLKTIGADLPATAETWLQALLRQRNGVYQPLRCLLLIRLLWDGLTEFQNASPKWRPFGEGPWPCLNRLSDHYGEPVIEGVRLKAKNSREGIFRCNLCGYSYARVCKPDVAENCFGWDELISTGKVWADQVAELLAAGAELKVLAKELEVHLDTIRKQAAGLIRHEKAEADEQKKRDLMRASWLKVLEVNEYKRMKAVREQHGDLYSWLYRHDRVWLRQNWIKTEKRPAIGEKVDWLMRDLALLKQVQLLIQSERENKGKPVRITVTGIAKNVGAEAMIRKHPDKLPLTMARLKNEAETTQQFHLRKLQWAGRVLRQNGEAVTEWNLRKTAAMTRPIDEVERAAILQIIHESGGDRDAD